MAFLCFGLTGGLAAGKTTVALRFRARGLPVIDADEVAREVVAPGSPALAEIAEQLGPGVLDPEGRLDRAKLGVVVFGDDAARRKLEAIIHPRIAARSRERIEEARRAGHPVACYDAALLVESGRAPEFRPLVVVSAPEALQLARAVRLRGLTEAEARARLAAQLPLGEKLAVADYVIDNRDSIAEVESRADEVLDAILRGAAIDPARYPRP